MSMRASSSTFAASNFKATPLRVTKLSAATARFHCLHPKIQLRSSSATFHFVRSEAQPSLSVLAEPAELHAVQHRLLHICQLPAASLLQTRGYQLLAGSIFAG